MKKTTLLILALLICALLPLSMAWAQDKPGDKPKDAPAAQKGKTILDFEKDLGLSKDQVDQLKSLMTEMQQDLLIFYRKLRTEEAELNDMVSKNADLVLIRVKLTEIGHVQGDIRYINIRASYRVNTILSKTQQTKWKEIQKKESEQK